MGTDTSWWVDRFEKACVLPVFNQPEVSGNDDQHVSFDVHIGQAMTFSEQLEIRALVTANKQSRGDSGFWVVTFQDHDPRGFHNHDPGVPRPIQIFSHPG